MNFLVIVFLATIGMANCEFNEENFVAQLNLIDMDLEDECDDISESTRNYILKGSSYLKERTQLLEGHGSYLRKRAEHLKTYFSSESDYPSDYERNLTLLLKSGDALLPHEEYNKLVHFYLTLDNQDINAKIPCLHNEQDCTLTLSGLKNTLATSRNVTVQRDYYETWTNIYSDKVTEFGDILELVRNASTANGYFSVKEYWEATVEVPDGYEKAKLLWEEIEPFYKNLQTFVVNRLNNYYKTNYTEVPAYLLGSLHGEEWSNIADIILPHPQLLYDFNVELQTLPAGQNLYKLAENATKSMGLGRLGTKFFAKSHFQQESCTARLLPHCANRFSEVITCNGTKLSNYMTAHSTAMKIAMNNQDYGSLPRQSLRESVLNDAFEELGHVLALGHAPFNGLLPRDTYRAESKNKITALLLTALKNVPKLPYYLLCDLWRLEELENKSSNVTESWWNFRKKYQGLQVPENFPSDFLSDNYITKNKPYLSKFFGVILQFQLLGYYQIGIFEEDISIPKYFKDDESFKMMINDRPNKNALELLNYNYGLSDVLSYDILYYLEPLNQYFNTSGTSQAAVVKHTATNKLNTTPKPKIRVKTPFRRKNSTVTVTAVVPKVDIKENVDVSKKTKEEKNLAVEKEPQPISEQKRNSYIFIGVACGLIVLVALYGVFVKCRKKLKQKTNNRRFEA